MGGAARFVIREGECPFCRLVREESVRPDRLVWEDHGSVAFAPYASRSPFEVWIVPRRHEADFGRAAAPTSPRPPKRSARSSASSERASTDRPTTWSCTPRPSANRSTRRITGTGRSTLDSARSPDSSSGPASPSTPSRPRMRWRNCSAAPRLRWTERGDPVKARIGRASHEAHPRRHSAVERAQPTFRARSSLTHGAPLVLDPICRRRSRRLRGARSMPPPGLVR